MTGTLPDQSARDQALAVDRSFIVQAPAGSGKTELLSLRYLKLLTLCRQPEEVLAITFTRKASSEMLDRIIRALLWCQDCMDGRLRPQNPIEKLRYQIGQSVLEKNAQLNWQLLENPTRFRVQTIDSFCFYLARQLPVLSQAGADPQLQESIDQCFRTAITATLEQLESASPIANDIETLLIHLDNNIPQVQRLLLGLLKSRDQWDRHLAYLKNTGDRGIEKLERHLAEWISESITLVRQQLLDEETDLVSLYNFAAENLARDGRLREEKHEPLTGLPGTRARDLPRWLVIVNFLLTNQPGWLKRATRIHGFPANTTGSKSNQALIRQMKETRQELIDRLRNEPELLESLQYLRLFPVTDIESGDWAFLVALFRVLHHLSGQLILAMRKLKVVDYTQISVCAMRTLGEEEEPTDITLALDHVIHHILVDEFQDTSLQQIMLLERLTAGWEPGDGRSLFLVGDPVQSCYGFRNANVGIYLHVMEKGLSNVALESLRLSTNFRSQANIVNWVNEVFSAAFPHQMDKSRGAVPYSMADAVHDPLEGLGVSLNIVEYAAEDIALAREVEAATVVSNVSKLCKNHPADTIAILVRNRSHLSALVPKLRQAGLSWTASDIDRLDSLAVIDDIMCVLRVVLNPGDRLAWIALLRAPWCGLGIQDLHTLATHEPASCLAGSPDLYTAVRHHDCVAGLSDRARLMLSEVVPVVQFILDMRFRASLRDTVETGWRLLRGPACATSQLDNDSAQCLLDLIAEKEVAGNIADIAEFELAVENAFVPSPETETPGLHIMTMHKAKGLEFDHVLIPCLNQIGRSDEKPLYISHERVNQEGENCLFLAGLTAAGEDDSPLYRLLLHEQDMKNQFESTRLLYISVTRARKTAFLSATLCRNDNENSGPPLHAVKQRLGEPSKVGLLAKIWPHVDDSKIRLTVLEQTGSHGQQPVEQQNGLMQPAQYRRFNAPWQLTDGEKAIQQNQLLSGRRPGIRVPEANVAAIIGTLIHRGLEQYVLASDQQAWLKNLGRLRPWWRLQFRHLSEGNTRTERSSIEAYCDCVEQQLTATVTDNSICWLFDPALEGSACELPLSRLSRRSGDQWIENRVIDRTFIFEGQRWIIDYKTTTPETDREQTGFIERKSEEFKPQLRVYKRLFRTLDPGTPVKTALLFTALPRLVEVAVN